MTASSQTAEGKAMRRSSKRAFAKGAQIVRVFEAHWFERTDVHAAAKLAGWDPESDGHFNVLLDIYPVDERHEPRVGEFRTLIGATRHLQFIIQNERDFWGQATIYEVEKPRFDQRCKICTCGGHRAVGRYIVDETGIIETLAEEVCWDGTP